MRNKFMIMSICAFAILCGTCSCGAKTVPDTPEDTDEAVLAADESAIADLQDAENGIHLLQDKLRKRKYDLTKREEYEKVHGLEMRKCGELKKEIRKLKDDSDELTTKINKLVSDKENIEAQLASHTETYKNREKDIKVVENEISANDKKYKALSAVCEKEDNERSGKIGKLKESLKLSEDKLMAIATEGNQVENDLKMKNAEYQAENDKLKALKEKLASPVSAKKGALAKDEMPVKDESPEIEKKMRDLMSLIQKGEEAKKKLSEDILAVTAEKKTQEKEIEALEDEGALKTKDLKAFSENLEKDTKAARAKIEKLKRRLISARSKMKTASAEIEKLKAAIGEVEKEKLKTETDLKTKTEEFKVRVSVLLGQYDEKGLLNEADKKSAAKSASKGEELTAKLDRLFEAIKSENDRLIAENKEIKARLERAEKTADAAKRRAENASKTPEELKAKINKERLDMHFNLAVVYEKNGLWHDAEREYLKCLRIDPKDPGVHYNLGILYDDKLNRNNKAMYHYYKFLSLRPMGDTAERVRDWITKLELENRLGKELR